MLEEIKEMWKEDCKIDPTRIVDVMVGIPNLHSKYLDILSSLKLKYRKADSDLLRLRRNKVRYYRGEMTKGELDRLGWEQWQGVKPLKSDLEDLITTDEDIILKQDQIEYFKVCMDTVEMIMRSIHSRGYDMGTLTKYLIFQSGS